MSATETINLTWAANLAGIACNAGRCPDCKSLIIWGGETAWPERPKNCHACDLLLPELLALVDDGSGQAIDPEAEKVHAAVGAAIKNCRHAARGMIAAERGRVLSWVNREAKIATLRNRVGEVATLVRLAEFVKSGRAS